MKFVRSAVVGGHFGDLAEGDERRKTEKHRKGKPGAKLHTTERKVVRLGGTMLLGKIVVFVGFHLAGGEQTRTSRMRQLTCRKYGKKHTAAYHGREPPVGVGELAADKTEHKTGAEDYVSPKHHARAAVAELAVKQKHCGGEHKESHGNGYANDYAERGGIHEGIAVARRDAQKVAVAFEEGVKAVLPLGGVLVCRVYAGVFFGRDAAARHQLQHHGAEKRPGENGKQRHADGNVLTREKTALAGEKSFGSHTAESGQRCKHEHLRAVGGTSRRYDKKSHYGKPEHDTA